MQEYSALLAKRRRLPVDLVLLAAATLPVTAVLRPVYAASLPEARHRTGRRDSDDVDLLALAIRFDLPVWSNDNDFADSGMVWYTTTALLAKLNEQ